MLRTEFMEPRGISANALANALRVPPNRVGSIIHSKRAIGTDTALRLARAMAPYGRLVYVCDESITAASPMLK